MKKILFLVALFTVTTFAYAGNSEKAVSEQTNMESVNDVDGSTCRCKITIIDSNGKRAYKPTIHVEFNTGRLTNSFKKFYGNEDGVIEVTWDESDWGSSVKCSMTIGTGTFSTTWTKSTSAFTMSDGGSLTFDVRNIR